MLLGEYFPTFQRIIMHSSTGPNSIGLLNFEGTAVFEHF